MQAKAATIFLTFVIPALSAIAAVIASLIALRATKSAATLSYEATNKQIDLQTRAKMAEFRQAWINELRTQMASLQSLGVAPNYDHQTDSAFYKAGTMIELLMDRGDPRYAALQACMYEFLIAETEEEKFRCNAPFVRICQDILKTEWEKLKVEFKNP